MEKIDFCICGGGIIGLFIANKLLEHYPNHSVFLLEKSQNIGDSSSGRNSGVLHAGIFYKNNSLKHKLCIEGNHLWRSFAKDNHIDINDCGKFIIACSSHERNILEKIYNNGILNQVPKLTKASSDQLHEIKKYTHALDAIYSPFTSIINVPQALKVLDKQITNNGGHILKNQKVIDLTKLKNGFEVQTNDSKFMTNVFINCAGLESVSLRKLLNLKDLKNHYIKGSYLKTSQSFYNQSLIYPVNDEVNNTLGIHTVISFDGSILFGPDAEAVDSIDYSICDKTISSMKDIISKTFKGVNEQKLSPDYSGIRSKITHNGHLYQDFWIKDHTEHNINGYIELLGIESPGLTAAPAIADYVINLFRSNQS